MSLKKLKRRISCLCEGLGSLYKKTLFLIYHRNTSFPLITDSVYERIKCSYTFSLNSEILITDNKQFFKRIAGKNKS